MSELTSLFIVVLTAMFFSYAMSRLKDPGFPADGVCSLSSALRALFGTRHTN